MVLLLVKIARTCWGFCAFKRCLPVSQCSLRNAECWTRYVKTTDYKKNLTGEQVSRHKAQCQVGWRRVRNSLVVTPNPCCHATGKASLCSKRSGSLGKPSSRSNLPATRRLMK